MENYERAEQDYMGGMKYKDIAEKYGTTINTVKELEETVWVESGRGCTQK